MKKFSMYFCALCAMMAFSFTSCSDDEEPIPTPIFEKSVSGLSFTDENEEPGKISGKVTWEEPADKSGIAHYVIYGAMGDSSVELGKVPVGTTSFTLENVFYVNMISVVAVSTEGNVSGPAVGISVEDNQGPSMMFYFLGSGSYGNNNASLYAYDPIKETLTPDYFKTQNGRGLGDTAQDMIVYGEKMYIAVYGESTIEVTDLKARSIKQIKTEGQPRALVADGGNVYISYFNGYVARLDTASLEVEQKIQVGRNPEQMAIAGGKLYVANSGGMDYSSPIGYDHTVSVVDLSSFTETKKLEVALNPCGMQTNGTNEIYVVSMGNYADVPNTLQVINTETETVSVIEAMPNATEIAYLDGTLFSFYSQWSATGATSSFTAYDTTMKMARKWLDDNAIPGAYKICVAGINLLVSSSDYTNIGDVHCIDTQGRKLFTVEGGFNPIKTVLVEF